MSNLTARTPSPVKVVITGAGPEVTGTSSRSPGSGRTRSPEGPKPTVDSPDGRRGSPRPLSVDDNLSTHLKVPGSNGSTEHLSEEETRTTETNDNSSTTPRTHRRSVSPSSYNKGLPSGSATFQKVLFELLAEEGEEDRDRVPSPKDKTPKPRQGRRRSSISAAVPVRRKSVYS